MSEFVFPSNVEGYCDEPMGRLLYDLACDVPERGLIVELGTYKGQSAICLGQSGRQVITLDHYQGETRLGQSGKFDHVAGRYRTDTMRNLQPYPNIHAIQSQSAAYVDGSGIVVDLLFVDASHEAGAVEADMRAWLTAMAPSGRILFDDWTSHPGVKEGAERVIRLTDWYCSDILLGRLALFERNHDGTQV